MALQQQGFLHCAGLCMQFYFFSKWNSCSQAATSRSIIHLFFAMKQVPVLLLSATREGDFSVNSKTVALL
jgi:hypothetical protein